MPKFKKVFKKKGKGKKHKLLRWPSNNLATYKTKIMGTFNLAQGGTAGNVSTAFCMNYPTYGFTQAGAYGVTVNAPTNYARLLSCFDVYRVHKMKITYMPGFVDITQGTSQDIGALYAFPDLDDVQAIPTQDSVLNAGIFPQSTVSGKTCRFKMSQVSDWRKHWNNTALYNAVPTSAPVNNAVTMLAPYSSYKFLLIGVPANTYYGSFTVEWYVEFRGQQAS